MSRVLDVVPTWQEHKSGASCWCGPIYGRNLVSGNLIWTHRAASDDPHRYRPEADPATLQPERTWTILEFPQ